MNDLKFKMYVLSLLVAIIRFQIIAAFGKNNAVPEVEDYLKEVERFSQGLIQ